MGLLEDKGEELARKAHEAELRYGDASIPEEIGKAIGATSTTLQESYLTALRIIRAAKRGDDLLARIVEGRDKGQKVVATETALQDDPNIH
jgi:hypothetical protein